MSWWLDLKDVMRDLFPPKAEPPEPEKRFIPPHASQPDGKPQPEWPPREQRK
jgi:hypothetical protein